MTELLQQIEFDQWGERRDELLEAGWVEPFYGGPLSRHVDAGDFRLSELMYDDSAASLDLWNFLLTEEERLHSARARGTKIVGTMKDLGTVPIMAYSLPQAIAFYPDGAFWIPCIMRLSAGLLAVADSMGIDESFCPVRAVLGAFATKAHFPIPDLLTCSVGATCDDFSAIAQRLEAMGHPILWWETPHRRHPDPDEPAVDLPGGFRAPTEQVALVRAELERIRRALGEVCGEELDDARLGDGIRAANAFRNVLRELRTLAFSAARTPIPALEMLVAEMLAIHYCSDRDEALRVLTSLLDVARSRARSGAGFSEADAARVFWVNPVADLRAMHVLEDSGGRIAGTEYLFSHALDPIPEDRDPMDALAMMALADPMVGSASDRAERVCTDCETFGAEAVLVSRIPGASHCAAEGTIIADIVADKLGLPVVEVEVPPISDSVHAALRNRIEALVEVVKQRRKA